MDEAASQGERASPPPAGEGGHGDVRTPGDRDTGGRGSSEFSMVPLGWLAAGAGVVAILLYAVQQSLRLPSAFGVEDLLGWSGPATVTAAVLNWCRPTPQRWHAAAAYVLVDTAFFMPFYGALIIAAATAMRRALQTGPARVAHALQAGLLPVTVSLLVLLWVCDALENVGGAQRLALPQWTFVLALIVAAILFWTFMQSVVDDSAGQSRRSCLNTLVLAVATLVIGAVALVLDGQAACDAARGFAASFGFAWAHRFKPVAIALALLPLAIAVLVWWFGIDLDLDDPHQKVLAERRAAWRSGVAGVVGRTRYVLILLVLFAIFTLVLDQCRDVLLALAGPLGAEADRDPLTLLWRAFVLLTGAASIGILSYSCWLWTRLVGMVERPGLALPGGHPVLSDIGEFARGWARAVALAPLVMVCLLIAHAVGDAVSAARPGPGSAASNTLPATLGYLFLFGLFAVLSGYLFIEVRRRLSLARPADYYNSVDDAYALLRTGTTLKPHARAVGSGAIGGEVWPAEPNRCRERVRALLRPLARLLTPVVHRLVPWTRPIVLPLLSLGVMVLLRIGMACWPDTAAQAPATLALLALALAWWMGVLGALSLAEQRQTIPWGIVIVAVMGVLSWADLVDNHVLPLSSIGAATEAVVAMLRINGLIVTVLLAFLGAAWWVLAAYRPAGAGGSSLRRAALAAFTLAICVTGLHLVDESTARQLGPPPAAVTDRSMRAVFAEWVRELPPASASDNRIYLVASEGGGIRSAYWTAQVLAGLHDQNGTFDRRVAVLSGVSGGAVGEAVYRACLRQVPRGPIGDCVRTRFARLDALSPLIGGFVFEDAFARLLPLNVSALCGLPACGYLSRALGFEREWMRRFPALAEPLGPARRGEPELMLNSTWVESGNRATFATMRMESADIPASEDAVARLGAEPSLVTAAHAAARFPFINPLATVVPVNAAEGAGTIVGHLADGGYHDNSGAESLADAWRALRAAKLPADWHPQLVLIRNGQLKPGCDTEGKKEPEPRCLSEAPGAPSDLAAPLMKSQWKLYVDAVGPAVAVVNVSGVGAHGRQAPASLSADLGALAATSASQTPPLSVWLLDQTTAATLVPLGWYLSPAAREALDVQAKCALQPGSCAPRP